MSADPTDLIALTPGHILVGGALLSIEEPKVKRESKFIISLTFPLKIFVIKDDNLPTNEWRLGRIRFSESLQKLPIKKSVMLPSILNPSNRIRTVHPDDLH